MGRLKINLMFIKMFILGIYKTSKFIQCIDCINTGMYYGYFLKILEWKVIVMCLLVC